MSIAEYPPPVGEVRKVWSPADARQLAERASDISIETLNELADQVFTANPLADPLPIAYIAVQAALSVAEHIGCDPAELFRLQREPWRDLIAEQLAEWPARIICPEVCP
jgi:hypothetical protein